MRLQSPATVPVAGHTVYYLFSFTERSTWHNWGSSLPIFFFCVWVLKEQLKSCKLHVMLQRTSVSLVGLFCSFGSGCWVFFLFLFFNCFSFRGVLLKGFILWFLGASSPSLHSSACVELDHALDSQSGRLALNVCSPACAYCRAKWATAVWAMPKQVPF